MSIPEKLLAAKALIESALEEAQNVPPPSNERGQLQRECEHKNSEEVTGAGTARQRWSCLDCGVIWEADDAN